MNCPLLARINSGISLLPLKSSQQMACLGGSWGMGLWDLRTFDGFPQAVGFWCLLAPPQLSEVWPSNDWCTLSSTAVWMAACDLELPNATDSDLACIISLGLINVCLLECFAFLVSLILSSNSICLGEHGCLLFSLLCGARLHSKPPKALPSTEHDCNVNWPLPCFPNRTSLFP